MLDEFFMKAALAEAQKAYDLEEVPVGAVVVFQNQIISSAHNQVESLQDATAHAEMLALRQAAQTLGNWRLLNCTLYSTLEPCPMCAGALISSRVKRVVWAAPDVRQGAGGSLLNVFNHHPIHQVEQCPGILREESADLLKKFFQERRKCKMSLMN